MPECLQVDRVRSSRDFSENLWVETMTKIMRVIPPLGENFRGKRKNSRSNTRRIDGILFILEFRKDLETMSQDQPGSRAPLFSQIAVTQGTYMSQPQPTAARETDSEHIQLLREILAAQDRQSELLEELVNQLSGSQKQRATELGQWKQANPHLARSCRLAAEALGRVQTEFLSSLTREVTDNFEVLMDGEFMLNEFVDRFGPRLAHLNGLLQVLSQLSSTPSAANAANSP
jgi:hypothetical protein